MKEKVERINFHNGIKLFNICEQCGKWGDFQDNVDNYNRKEGSPFICSYCRTTNDPLVKFLGWFFGLFGL